MEVTFRCRAILLDMDGTLVDSTKSVVAQWGRWAKRHGLALEDILKISHGRPALETMQLAAPTVASPEELARFVREEELHETGSVAIRGAVRFVEKIPADRWAVVTSAPGNLARRRLQAAGFPKPQVLIAPEDAIRGKPDPLPYMLAAERLGISPADCFVVEDTRPGLESAYGAGMAAIGITTTYSQAQLGAKVAVPDFESLDVDGQGDTLLVRVARMP